MACEVPSGVVADRLGRKSTLLLGALVNGAGCFLFAAADSFALFATGEVLFALGTAMISGADSAMLYDSLAAEGRESEYPKAEGSAQAIWLLVTAAGLPLADRFLVRNEDPVLAYWLTGFLMLLGGLCALAMREPPVARRASTREITVGATRDVVRIPGIARVILYSVGVFVLLRAAVVIFYNPSMKASGVPVHFYGTILAAVNVTGAVAAVGAHRLLARIGEGPLLWAMPLSMVIMFALLALVRIPLAAALFCIQGAVYGAYPLVVRSILNRHVPSASRRATILSIESMVCRIAFGLVAALSARALGGLGLAGAIAVTTAAGCLPFAFLPLLRRGVRPATAAGP
jgi:MFS family permease